jgi:hypothetical protein
MKHNRTLLLTLLAAAASVINQSVCAEMKEDSSTISETKTPEQLGAYGLFDKSGIVLFSTSTDNRTRRAFLQIDQYGKPALYPCQRFGQGHTATELRSFSYNDAKTEWKASPMVDFSKVELHGWRPGSKEWDSFSVDLRFKDGLCSAFQMYGPGIQMNDWIPSDQIPKKILLRKAATPLPVEITCIEGPTPNGSDCGRFDP